MYILGLKTKAKAEFEYSEHKLMYLCFYFCLFVCFYEMLYIMPSMLICPVVILTLLFKVAKGKKKCCFGANQFPEISR